MSGELLFHGEPAALQVLLVNFDGARNYWDEVAWLQAVLPLAAFYLGKGKPTIFFGKDENALEAFLVGARGWVSGAANVTIKLQKEMYDAFFKENDITKAKKIYFKLLPWFFLTERRGRWISYVKAALNLIGYGAGVPRLPLLPLSSKELEDVKEV